MLTRREVEGELRSLGFRASARQRRAERERARRFARAVLGAMVGFGMVTLLSAVNLLRAAPSGIANGRTGPHAASEWVGGDSSAHTPRRTLSLFFSGRRTRHPDDPRNHREHRHSSDD